MEGPAAAPACHPPHFAPCPAAGPATAQVRAAIALLGGARFATSPPPAHPPSSAHGPGARPPSPGAGPASAGAAARGSRDGGGEGGGGDPRVEWLRLLGHVFDCAWEAEAGGGAGAARAGRRAAAAACAPTPPAASQGAMWPGPAWGAAGAAGAAGAWGVAGTGGGGGVVFPSYAPLPGFPDFPLPLPLPPPPAPAPPPLHTAPSEGVEAPQLEGGQALLGGGGPLEGLDLGLPHRVLAQVRTAPILLYLLSFNTYCSALNRYMYQYTDPGRGLNTGRWRGWVWGCPPRAGTGAHGPLCIPSHPIPSHPIPSHPIPSHPMASHGIPWHPIPFNAMHWIVCSSHEQRTKC
jgi:hypothetical protein